MNVFYSKNSILGRGCSESPHASCDKLPRLRWKWLDYGLPQTFLEGGLAHCGGVLIMLYIFKLLTRDFFFFFNPVGHTVLLLLRLFRISTLY